MSRREELWVGTGVAATAPTVPAQALPPVLEIDETDAGAVADAADRAASVLRDGGTVVLPTDTVYGVAALPYLDRGIASLVALKERDVTKPLAVLVADHDQGLGLVDLDALVDDGAKSVKGLTDRWWPGALTLVVPRHVNARLFALGGDGSKIGIRCPASAVVRAIAARVGPIATTSANRSGEPTPLLASSAAASLAGSVSLVIDAGPCTSVASTVLDASVVPFRVIRLGPIGAAELGLVRELTGD